MKLSLFTTITNPKERGDNYINALDCYTDLADEVVVVNGGKPLNKNWFKKDLGGPDLSYELKEVMSEWPVEFDWLFIGKQFQKGYEACTGDWVIKTDIDYLFHENDFTRLRETLERNNDSPALSLWKYQFTLPDRYNLKSRLLIAVNKKVYGNRLKFDSGGDLCQVSLDGRYLTPDDVPQSGIAFYNYEKILKTKEQISVDQGRMERAWYRHFGEYQMKSDGTDESAFLKWIEAQQGKLNKPQQHIKLEQHPKYIQQTIKDLKPENFGYNGFGYLIKNDYVIK